MIVKSRNLFALLWFSCLTCSVFGQTPSCPEQSELEPYCGCRVGDERGYVYLDCNRVENENQLEEIFTNANFPTLNVFEFKIANNWNLKYLTRNVFGDVTFQLISFQNNTLEYISDAVFVNSVSTLLRWDTTDCRFTSTQNFPFYSLNLYTKFRQLLFFGGDVFNVLPKISSNSLNQLVMINVELQYLPMGVFDDLPNLDEIYLYENKIVSIEPGIFDQNPLLVMISMFSNNIAKLASGTFRNLPNLETVGLMDNKITQIEIGAFSNCPSLTGIYLENNYISTIGSGAFDVLVSGALALISNQITTLDENWLKTPLMNLNEVDISYNPLQCGCDIAWLFIEPSLMDKLTASCSNGTDIHSLNPSYFSTNC